jgi:phospholipase/carboxylesterase
VIPQAYAEQTAQALQALGMPLQWQRYPMAHQVCAEEIADLRDWMSARFAAG